MTPVFPTGYYDAGDYIKFGFPMASMTTLIAWGGISYKRGYERACEYNNLKTMVKWATDYFIASHTAPNEYIGQIGNGKLDHDFWGRPEDMRMQRPAYKISPANPGSDLAGETAAALAAASVLFKTDNPAYADICLSHAKGLFKFAMAYKGKYSDSIKDADKYYRSS